MIFTNRNSVIKKAPAVIIVRLLDSPNCGKDITNTPSHGKNIRQHKMIVDSRAKMNKILILMCIKKIFTSKARKIIKLKMMLSFQKSEPPTRWIARQPPCRLWP
jgi:hypothetical protein